MIELVTKKCVKCDLIRRFVWGSPRDKEGICGNCWDWVARPPQPLDLVGGKI